MRLKFNDIKEKKKKKAYQKYGNEVLVDISNVMHKYRYKGIFMQGTLLGLMRDNKLIPWDDDIDIILLKDNGFSWNKFEQDMKKSGFLKTREINYNNRLYSQTYRKKNVVCDFTYWNDSDESKVRWYGGYEIEGLEYKNNKEQLYKTWKTTIPAIMDISYLEIEGNKLQIPMNSDEILSATYGENWKTPNPNYIPKKERMDVMLKVKYFNKKGKIK